MLKAFCSGIQKPSVGRAQPRELPSYTLARVSINFLTRGVHGGGFCQMFECSPSTLYPPSKAMLMSKRTFRAPFFLVSPYASQTSQQPGRGASTPCTHEHTFAQAKQYRDQHRPRQPLLSVFPFPLTHRGADVISHPTKHARRSRSTTRSLFPQDALPPRRQILQGRKSKTRPLTWVYCTSGILTNDHLDIFQRNLLPRI